MVAPCRVSQTDTGHQQGFGAQTAARYLGPHITNQGTAAVEITIRITAARNAWYEMSGFWFKKGVDWAVKVGVFKAICMSTLLTGLVSYYLGEMIIKYWKGKS